MGSEETFMRQYRTTLIALGVIVLALVGFFLAKNFISVKDDEPTATQAPTSTVEYMVNANNSEFNRVECFYKEKLKLKLEGSTWFCTDPSDFSIYSTAAYNLVSDFAGLSGTVIIGTDEYPSDNIETFLEFYGITENSPYFEAFRKDGTSVKLIIGNATSTGSMYYAKIDGINKIYTITATKFLVTRSALIDSTIFSFSDVEQIKEIVINKNGVKETELRASFVNEDKTWNMLKPIVIGGNIDGNIKSLVSSLEALAIESLQESNSSDLSIYGLSVPVAEYILADSKSTQSIQIGNKSQDGLYYYCTINNNKDVYTVLSSSITFIDNDPLLYANCYPYIETWTNLDSIDITTYSGGVPSHNIMRYEFTGGKIYDELTDQYDVEAYYYMNEIPSYKKDDNGSYIYGDPNDDVDLNWEFKGIYTQLISIQIDGLCEEPVTKGDLLCRIVYKTKADAENPKEAAETVFEYYYRDDTTAYIYKNGVFFFGYTKQSRIYGADGIGIVGTIDLYKTELEKAIANS